MHKNIDVILLHPEIGGNVGAIARSMKNFGFSNLVIVDPECEVFGIDAKNRAKHANDILDKAKIIKSFKKEDYDYSIGTSGKLGSDYNIPRTPLTASELSQKIHNLTKRSRIALVFGRESCGMTNEELKMMDFLVHIPTSLKYQSLNLSHAVAIMLYEISKITQTQDLKKKYTPAANADKDRLCALYFEMLDNTEFERDSKRETQKKVWKNLQGRAMLSKRETFALMGFFRKIIRKIEQKKK